MTMLSNKLLGLRDCSYRFRYKPLAVVLGRSVLGAWNVGGSGARGQTSRGPHLATPRVLALPTSRENVSQTLAHDPDLLDIHLNALAAVRSGSIPHNRCPEV